MHSLSKNIYHVRRLYVNWQSVFCTAEWGLTTPARVMSSKLGLFQRAGTVASTEARSNVEHNRMKEWQLCYLVGM